MKLSVAIAVMCLSVAGAAHAQQVDSRWSPWLGCWALTGDNVRVCVEPYQGTGVRLTTTVEKSSEPVLAQTLVADGTRQPVAEGECSGWQQADWSGTGERLFARAELTCKDGSTRTVTGLSTIVNGMWLDIQGIEIAGRENIRVRKYRRAPGQAAPSPRATALAPRLGSTPFTIADVKEASARVSPGVMEAALVETGSGFNLSSQALLDLDRAGVADRVLDAMVALSYPRQFVVDRRPSPQGSLLPDIDDTWYGGWSFPYYSSSYGAYSPYLYSPFGYGYWGSYYPYGYSFIPGGGVIPLVVDSGAGGAGDGRAVNGVGYTRIRSRADVEAEQANIARRTGDSGVTNGTTSTRGDSSSSSGSSSGGASPSGFSSGSSSTDTGRTAQPR